MKFAKLEKEVKGRGEEFGELGIRMRGRSGGCCLGNGSYGASVECVLSLCRRLRGKEAIELSERGRGKRRKVCGKGSRSLVLHLI